MIGDGVIAESVISFEITWKNPGNGEQPKWDQNDQKIYYHHSGYTGGLKETSYRHLMEEKPEFAVKRAIIGMLPKGPLGRKMAKKLRRH